MALLKSLYTESLESVSIVNVKMVGKPIWYNRDQIIVDVALVHTSSTGHEWMKCDKEYHLRTYTKTSESITYSNILNNTDTFVLLRGIAGIGKTVLLDTLQLMWAKNEIWNGRDDQPDIRHVFRFNCRALNLIQKDLSAKQLFQWSCPKFFKSKTFADVDQFKCIDPEKLILILDGLDEFKDLRSFYHPSYMFLDEHTEGKIGEVLAYIFDKDKGCFPGHKAILAGRPDAIRTVRSTYGRQYCVKEIDVVGFSDNSVKQYINNISGNDTLLRDTLLGKIDDSYNLKAMSHVPVYLWIICAIFKENRDLTGPKTVTELYVWAFGVFLREHFKNQSVLPPSISKDFTSTRIQDLFKYKEVHDIVNVLSLCSYKMLLAGKVVFTENEMSSVMEQANISEHCVSAIITEESGFITKEYDDADSIVYQFKHLTLHEFFAAIFLLRNRNHHSFSMFMKQHNRDSEVLPVVAGLAGGLFADGDQPSIVSKFVKALDVTMDSPVESFMIKVADDINKQPNLNPAFRTPYLYLFCIYEFGHEFGHVPENIVKKCASKFSNEWRADFHHHLQHVIYFLKHVKAIHNYTVQLTVMADVLSMKVMRDFTEVLQFVEMLRVNSSGQGKLEVSVPKYLTKEICQRLVLKNLWISNVDDEILTVICKCVPFLTKFLVESPKRINGWNTLSQVISGSPLNRLEYLILYRVDITDQLISLLQSIIRHIQQIKVCGKGDKNDASDETWAALANSIVNAARDGTLKTNELALEACKLKQEHFSLLAKCLPDFKKVSLSFNGHTGSEGYRAIGDIIYEAVTTGKTMILKELDLIDNELELDQLEFLIKAVPYIRYVDISSRGYQTVPADRFMDTILKLKPALDNQSALKKIVIPRIFNQEQQQILRKELPNAGY